MLFVILYLTLEWDSEAKKERVGKVSGAIYPSFLLGCNIYIYSVYQQRRLFALEEPFDQYSACTGRLSRTTDDLACASELYPVIGLSPYVDTIIYLGLQLQHLVQTDKKTTQHNLLNLHGCTKKE